MLQESENVAPHDANGQIGVQRVDIERERL